MFTRDSEIQGGADVKRQGGRWRTPAVAALAVLIATAAIVGLADRAGYDVSALIRDAAAEFDVPISAGSVSFIGVVMLLLTSGAAAVTAMATRTNRAVLAAVGLLSLMLALDDQFMLHERIIKRYFGIEEEVVMAVYALWATGLLIAVWRGRLKPWVSGLLVPAGVMALSVTADQVGTSYVIEDLLKVTGFGAWAAFWVSVSRATLQGHA
ncbi:hypothetical protein [Tropicimonas isoalkanivorans]|uniref:Uncharacterized protein n=1 Tax=Tropicimonas isoalkanivorans TaxID=441112 RepID=A0A1I1DPL8_9RHOB|nr:hypothetical protein [Tropicimonas isoalkanivorans]SFB76905.1 hypothetical protein SAMN04488094_101400 [Tropicimonas isoalkanivorans]